MEQQLALSNLWIIPTLIYLIGAVWTVFRYARIGAELSPAAWLVMYITWPVWLVVWELHDLDQFLEDDPGMDQHFWS